ncbi:uncharacterized protein LOC130673190 [Microplitis mediator]|uniref:uncharacterized protein LOC130673190 n=1 Tax=Microplitis mediator TaxID=375433 RepID=UPI002555B78B|nr:uncharacterized protein LOC130673190 [Microplitis mediator]
MNIQIFGIAIILAFYTTIPIDGQSVSDILKYECSPSSVKINFKPRSPQHEVTLSTDYRIPECVKKFNAGESAVMELNFEKCTSGAKTFHLNINEYKEGEMDPSLYSLEVKCLN